jgi:hypothetical protein
MKTVMPAFMLKVFLCFAQLQPRLRLGLQSLGLAQKARPLDAL